LLAHFFVVLIQQTTSYLKVNFSLILIVSNFLEAAKKSPPEQLRRRITPNRFRAKPDHHLDG
jgi:hypothetical protein